MARSGRTVFALALAAAFALSGPASRARGATRGEEGGDENIGEIIQTAKNGTSRERRQALSRLAGLRDREAIRQWDVIAKLVEFMRDADPRFARNAVRGLGDLAQWDRTVKNTVRSPLVKLLQDAEAHVIVRREAVTQLGRMCRANDVVDRYAVTALVAAARTGRTYPPEVAAAATRAVAKTGTAKARDVIRENLSHSDQEVRDAAMEAVTDALTGEAARDFAKDPRLIKRLLDLAGEPTIPSEERAKILLALGRMTRWGIRVPGMEAHLTKILREEKEESTVISALKAASLVGSPEVAAVLPEVYRRFTPEPGRGETGPSEVLVQVCETAGELFAFWGRKDRRADIQRQTVSALVDFLAGVVAKGEGDAQQEAVVALGNLYGRRYDRSKAVAILIALLATGDVSEGLAKAAAESLEVITGRAFGVDAKRWEKWFRANRAKLRPR